MNAQPTPAFLSFSLNEFKAPSQQQVYWREIHNGETIRAGCYHLKVGAIDDQTPHDYDEIYYVKNGVSKINVGKKSFDIRKGDIIYVQAKQTHYFHDITEDLDLLVLFSKGPSDPTESIAQIDSINQLRLKKENSKMVRIDFLKKKSMTMSLWMLPGATENEKSLIQPFDEMNFVVNGKGSFIAGDQKIEVGAGSLFFIGKNTPHHFEASEGLDVFILFETKSVQ